MGKHVGIETTLPTAIITSDMWVEATKKNGHTEITVGRETTLPTAVITSNMWVEEKR